MITLVLVGKGHNGGDALLAAHEILATHPAATAEIVFVYGARALRPLAQRAWQQLTSAQRQEPALVLAYAEQLRQQAGDAARHEIPAQIH